MARTPGESFRIDVPRPGTSGNSRKGVVDKKLASRFKVKDKPFQVPAPSSPDKTPWAVPIDQGLAVSTRFENFKKEQYTIQIEEVKGSPDSGAGASAEAIAAAAAEAEVLGMIDKEAFVHDVSQINHSIEDLSRSIRFEHLEKNSAQEKQDAAREEARRRKEAELRRARKKEQMARDPKRKVALRIENRRREEDLDARKDSKKTGSAKKTKQDIPLQKFEVRGPNGSSKVSIVDVQKIKHKCEFMDMPINVAEMLEIREKAERRSKLMNSTMSTNISSSLFQSVQSSLTTPCYSMSELSVDERLDRASVLRAESYAQTMLHKVSSMRNQWRYTVPYDLDVTDRHTPRGSSTLIVSKQHSTHKKDSKLAEELDKAVDSEDKRKVRRSSISSLTVLKQLAAPESFTSAKRASMQKMVRKKSQMEAEELAHYEALKARARRHWNVVRALVKVCILLFTTQKKNESAEMMKMLLKNCGEFLRISAAVRIFINAVKVLQRHMKAFLVLKRKRCMQIEKEWMRFEEHHLSVWFRFQAQAIVREQKAQAAEAQGASAARKQRSKGKLMLQLMEAGIKEGDDMVAVTGCMIPAKERRAVIQRFHNSKLRKHVRQSALVDISVKETLQAQRDLCSFLRTMGSDARPEVPHHLPKIDGHWHVLDEDTALGLIARCAQALAHVSGFQDHPANLAIPENLTTSYQEYVVGSDPNAFAARIMRAIDRIPFRGRFGRPPQMRTEDIIDEEQRLVGTNPSKRDSVVATGVVQEGQVARSRGGSKDASGGSDVEQVFNSFTPRLREIKEVQVKEYNESKRSEETGGNDPALQALKEMQKSDLLLSSAVKKEEK